MTLVQIFWAAGLNSSFRVSNIIFLCVCFFPVAGPPLDHISVHQKCMDGNRTGAAVHAAVRPESCGGLLCVYRGRVAHHSVHETMKLFIRAAWLRWKEMLRRLKIGGLHLNIKDSALTYLPPMDKLRKQALKKKRSRD